MGIKRVYGHIISSEYLNNCIDGFEATQRKLISSLEIAYVYIQTPSLHHTYVPSQYFMFTSPLCEKWNRDTFALW